MMGLSRVLAVIVLLCSVVIAQPKPTPPTAQQTAEIQRLAKRAITKSQANDHEGAIKDLLEAVAVHPASTAVLLLNIGNEYKQVKKPYDALRYFCMYLEKEPTGSAVTYVKAEAEVLRKELKLDGQGDTCAPELPKPKPEPKLEPVKPEPKGEQANFGSEKIDRPAGKPGSALRVAGIGVGVVGVAMVATGMVFGSRAKSKSDQISAGPPPMDPNCLDPDPVMCPRLDWGPHTDRGWDGIDKLQSDGQKFEKMQIAFTIAGSALVVGGVAMYFVGRSKKGSGEKVRVTPTIGPHTASLSLDLGF